MFDQLLSGVKDQAIGMLTEKTGLNADQAAGAFPLAGDAVKDGIMGAVTGGNVGGITDMLSAAVGGGGDGLLNNMIFKGIAGDFITKATSSLGIGQGLAQSAAAGLIPMLLSKIGGAAKSAGDTDAIDASSIMSVFGAGGGLADKAKDMLGGAAGGMLGKLMG